MFSAYVRALRGYSRNVRFILLASAIMGFTIDGGVFAVIFNLYILRLGYGPELVGQVNAAGLLVFALACLPAGALGGRVGSRTMLIAGIATCTVGALALPLADMLPVAWRPSWLILTYVILYLGVAMYYVNCSPVLVAVTAVEEHTRIISVQSALIGVLAFVGGVLAGVLPGVLAGFFGWSSASPLPYRYPLLLAALILLIALWSVLRLGEITPHAATVVGAPTGAPRVAIAFAGTLLLLSAVRFFQVAGVGTAGTFFNVYMDQGLAAPTNQIGLVSAFARLLAVPAALAVPFLTRRFGAANTALWSSVITVAGLLPMALLPNRSAASLGFVGVMASASIRYPAFFVYMMSITPPQLRATMSGAGEMAAGFSFALIALVGGMMIERIGYAPVFLVSGAITAFGSVLFFFFMRRMQR